MPLPDRVTRIDIPIFSGLQLYRSIDIKLSRLRLDRKVPAQATKRLALAVAALQPAMGRGDMDGPGD
jgi:hypothetical protein